MIVKRKLYSVMDEVKEKSSFIEKEKEFGRPFLGRRPLINNLSSGTIGGSGFMGSNVQRPKIAPKLDNPSTNTNTNINTNSNKRNTVVSKPPVANVNSRLKSLDETINFNLGLGGNNKSKSNWGNKFKTGVKTTVSRVGNGVKTTASGIGNTLAVTGLGLGAGVAMSMASSGENDD